MERCVNLGEIKKHSKATKSLPTSTDNSTSKTFGHEKEEELDPEFAEFVEIHSKGQKDKTIWGNDGIDGDLSKVTKKVAENLTEEEDTVDDTAHNKDLTDLEVSNFVGFYFGSCSHINFLFKNF